MGISCLSSTLYAQLPADKVESVQDNTRVTALTPILPRLISPSSTILSALKVCALVGMPGDFAVNKAYYVGRPGTWEADLLYHTIDPYGLGGALLDLISIRNPYQKWSHSAFIPAFSLRDSDIAFHSWFIGKDIGIENKYSPEKNYSENFAMYKVLDGIQTNVMAMTKYEQIEYLRESPSWGVCADNVNKMYDDVITAVHPFAYFLGEAGNIVDTPTRLANSPATERLCEVEHGKLIFPKKVMVKTIVHRALKGIKSASPALQNHGRDVLDFLERLGVVVDGKIVVEALPHRSQVRSIVFDTGEFDLEGDP